MNKKFVMILDYAIGEAFQVEVSEEDVVKMNENPDDWWEDYRRKEWFSSNCAWMASKKPMNVCIDSTEESEVTVKNRQGENRILKVSL
jgi:hypothetical protein